MTPANDNQNLEQTQESSQHSPKASDSELDEVNLLAGQLADRLGQLPEGDLVGQIILNAMKLLRDRTNRGDIKLINKSLQELRYALKIFIPYRDVRKVSLFGSARTLEDHADYRQAAEFAKKMAAAGWMVITGAGGGIMAAGHGGAGAKPSFGLAIRLPFEQKTNPFIADDPKLINFKYFFTRKLMFVRSSHAIALFPGGFGTMDEGFEVLTLIQTGKSAPVPIVLIDQPGGQYWAQWDRYVKEQLLGRGLISPDDLHLYKITSDVDEAVREVRRFYSNYHSIRYVKDDLVMRLHQAPNTQQLRHIETQFGSIKTGAPFRVAGALPAERDEPDLAPLPRLVFGFIRHEQGKLRMLIDYLNGLKDPS